MLEQANDLICIPLAYSAYFYKQSTQKKEKKSHTKDFNDPPKTSHDLSSL